MKKNKVLKLLLPLPIALGAIAPSMTGCNKTPAPKIESLHAEFKDGKQLFTVGETLSAQYINVSAIYDNGDVKTLEYDKEGKTGYTFDSEQSTFPIDHKFALADIKSDNILKIKFSDFTCDLTYDVNYSEKVSLYTNNATIRNVSEVVKDQDVFISYSPSDNENWTMFEETGVEINGITYNAYDNPEVISFRTDTTNEASRMATMVISGSIVSSDSMKIQIVTRPVENICTLKFKDVEHCTFEGSTMQLVSKGTKWGDIEKPKATLDKLWMIVGWKDNKGNHFNDSTIIDENTVVFPVLNISTITVSFTGENCEVSPKSLLVPTGVKWSYVKNKIAVDVKEHCEWDGWYDDQTKIDDSYEIKYNVTLTAKAIPLAEHKITITPGQGVTITGRQYFIVFGKQTWKDVKKIAEQEITVEPRHQFAAWLDSNDQPISDDKEITEDTLAVKATANYIGELNIDFKTEINGEWNRFIRREPTGFTGPVFVRYNDTKPYDEHIPLKEIDFKKPTWSNNQLVFESPKKNDNFRFMFQVIETDILIPSYTSPTIEYKFDFKDELWMNGHFNLSFSWHITEIFDLGETRTCPEHFVDMQQDWKPEYFDKKSVYHKCTKHDRGWWATEKHWEDYFSNTITVNYSNPTSENIRKKHYYGISYMISPRNDHDNGDSRGKLTTTISWSKK